MSTPTSLALFAAYAFAVAVVLLDMFLFRAN
jgi:hypothetical protein